MSNVTMRNMRQADATAPPVFRVPEPARGGNYRAADGPVFWVLAVVAAGMATLAVAVASGALW